MESPVPQDIVHPSPEPDLAPAPSAACSVEGEDGTSDGAAGGCAGSPVLVIRGESEEAKPSDRAQVALVDWLGFSVPPGEGRHQLWLFKCLQDVFKVPPEACGGECRPWSGYKKRINLIYPAERGESINLGLVAWGGESQRGTLHVELNGTACARITDWVLVQAWGESVDAVVTRCDAAHDDFEGKTITVEQARAWYDAGGFNTAGRPPNGRLVDDLGSGKGKTFYIGSRSVGKICRIYEKGKQLGDRESPWNRAEVEHRSKGRWIPWDIVTRPGDYLAGSYPCFWSLSERQDKIRTLRRASSISYVAMVENVRISAGRALNVMHHVEGGDAKAVLDQLMRPGAPKRLEPFAAIEGLLESVRHADPESA